MVDIVILAAGQGTRMRSALPKVLHPLGARPLLQHVLDTARALQPDRIHVVYGHGGEGVRDAFEGQDVLWWHQSERLGTAHALGQALPHIPAGSEVLVLYGDVPLIRPQTLRALTGALAGGADLALLTVDLDEPSGYGRIVRDSAGSICRIVEHREASERERQICEVNTGVLAARAADLGLWLGQIGNENTQGEFYLTDCIALATAAGRSVSAVRCEDPMEVTGINDHIQLAAAERAYQARIAHSLMAAGVTLADPQRIDIRGRLRVGRDITIDVNVIFEGEVELEDEVMIGPGCVIKDSVIRQGTRIQAYTVIEGADIGRDTRVGPFSRIRPGTRVDSAAHVGNFVELKNSRIGTGSKINHLSYIGDTELGAGVNVGAGTITCNYDGANKHRTVIEDDVFVGSSTQLVAPVTVGAGATIGAGSTITRDVPPQKLTLARARQLTIDGWRRPRKPRD